MSAAANFGMEGYQGNQVDSNTGPFGIGGCPTGAFAGEDPRVLGWAMAPYVFGRAIFVLGVGWWGIYIGIPSNLMLTLPVRKSISYFFCCLNLLTINQKKGTKDFTFNVV